ncbi:TRAP transporter small permease (plasmid) [Haloferacaceae archaeon DSL9]
MEVDQSLGLNRDTWYDRVILYTATALFALTIALATVQVLVRQLNIQFLGSMYWTEPAARFVLIVATYLGAAVATRNREHISIKFILERIEVRWPSVGVLLRAFVVVITLIFISVALYGTLTSAVSDWRTSIGGIAFVTSGVLYLGISVGLFLMIFYDVLNLKEDLQAFFSEEERVEASGESDMDPAGSDAKLSEGGE